MIKDLDALGDDVALEVAGFRFISKRERAIFGQQRGQEHG